MCLLAGLGCLLIRKDAEKLLCNKRYFGGGTVKVVATDSDVVHLKDAAAARLEDGTVRDLSSQSGHHGLTML